MAMESLERGSQIRRHAIQLIHLGVKELYIKSHIPPDTSIGIGNDTFSLTSGHGQYDKENKTIVVELKLESGTKEGEIEVPFSMRITLAGLFQVDEDKFPVEHILHWAGNNAPLILYPYLREHAFGLTTRCGFKSMLLPLLEVPTIRFSETPKPKKKKTPSKKSQIE